jgi:excisionase family DNA binding protein
MTPELLSPSQVARSLSVASQTVYRWIHEGRLDAVRVGHQFRVPTDSVADFVRRSSEEHGGASRGAVRHS